ncbi:uncharacterized protein LOC119097590 [Pollicipes pollicipes]|uniref:uncharacterized protein LOC119097590 n=1 Tax=Pollicipes pollicipes TaxID=41117 RepID=UPI00188520C6|nr:uncharacterized protein LOC119097590 [Pollicipes pollicipes]
MMFDFSEDAEAATGGASRGDGDAGPTRSQSQSQPEAMQKRESSDSYVGAEDEPAQGRQDAVSTLLPVLKDISHQFSEFMGAMETAVRDLAKSENDIHAELLQQVAQSRQVLAAHGRMQHRFTDRLSHVTRGLRAQQAAPDQQ